MRPILSILYHEHNEPFSVYKIYKLHSVKYLSNKKFKVKNPTDRIKIIIKKYPFAL